MHSSYSARILFAMFCLFFIFLITIESLGLYQSRDIALRSILLFAPIFLLTAIGLRISFEVPTKLSILFILFSITAAISTIFSTNPQFTFEHQLFYLAVFVISIVFYSIRHDNMQFFIRFIIFLLLAATIYSFVLPFLHNELLQPNHGYQFVYKYQPFLGHHPRAVPLLLLMITGSYYFVSQKKKFVGIGVFLGGLLLGTTFMRAAFVSYVLTMVCMFFQFRQHLSKKIFVSISFLLIFLTSCIFLVTTYKETIPVVSTIQSYIPLPDKPPFGVRDRYIEQSIHGILAKPWVGYGSFNFLQVSDTYESNPYWRAHSSHNMFLDFFVENGLIGGMLMVIIIANITWSGLKHRGENKYIDIFFYLFLSLTAIFLLTYYHRVYSLFLLYIVMGVFVYKENKNNMLL